MISILKGTLVSGTLLALVAGCGPARDVQEEPAPPPVELESMN